MEDQQQNPPLSHRQYYVDEAGDGTLFNGRGRVIIGQEGCSKYFMIGLLDVPDPVALSASLNTLREELLRDPYFRKVPSMDPSRGKTSVAFHAKDDIAEVRREVFATLLKHNDLRFFATIRDKQKVLLQVKTYKYKRYKPNGLYDQVITRLFKDRLHQDDAYTITFATRGSSDRTKALNDALLEARKRFGKKWDIHTDAPITIRAVPAASDACLQATDYFLWALQRCYERREDRYLEYLWPQCHLVHDIDDVRKNMYGVYYRNDTPLTVECLPAEDEEA